jgi:hypothetical protein
MQCASSLVYALFGRQFRANFGNFIIAHTIGLLYNIIIIIICRDFATSTAVV